MSIFMLVLFAITSLQPSLISPQISSGAIEEESAVYSALIRARYVNHLTKVILVFAETSAKPDGGSPPDRQDLRQIAYAYRSVDY